MRCRYADESGIFLMETSAKTASNVNELFVAIGAQQPQPSRRHNRRHPGYCCGGLHRQGDRADGRASAAERRRAP